MSQTLALVELSPRDVQKSLAHGEIVLVDVREPFEHTEAHIDGATLRPLGSLDAEALRQEFDGRRVVFHCKAGGRSAKAAEGYQLDGEAVYHLAGGIDAWIAAGLPVVEPERKAPLPIMRQVQIAAGSLVALGTGLGAFVHPGFLALSGFVGCGLVFAGVSGWCGMAKLLGAMPWNPKTKAGASCSVA